MSVIYLLVPLALLVGGLFVAAFIWATRRGQFDDLETPAVRMLFDDEPLGPPHPHPAPRSASSSTRSRSER